MEILRLLSRALKPFSHRFQPVLMWDAAKSHIRPDVLACAGKLGIWTIIVPAKVTWLLQPADTHCFARYKAFLRRKYLECSASASDGHVSTDDIILTINAAVREVFQKQKWQGSFMGNGFGHQQGQVRSKILEHLEWAAVPQVACTLPNLSQFAHIWPRRLDVPVDALFYAFLPHAVPPHRQRSRMSSAAADEAPVPWERRLRPRTGRGSDSQLDEAAADRPPATCPIRPVAIAAPCRTIPHHPARVRRPGLFRPRAIPRCRR